MNNTALVAPPQGMEALKAMRPKSDKVEVLERYLEGKFTITHNGLPGTCWQIEGGSWLHVEFMLHDEGCWVILSNRHSGEETGRINIGTFYTPWSIDALLIMLKSAPDNG